MLDKKSQKELADILTASFNFRESYYISELSTYNFYLNIIACRSVGEAVKYIKDRLHSTAEDVVDHSVASGMHSIQIANLVRNLNTQARMVEPVNHMYQSRCAEDQVMCTKCLTTRARIYDLRQADRSWNNPELAPGLWASFYFNFFTPVETYRRCTSECHGLVYDVPLVHSWESTRGMKDVLRSQGYEQK